MPTVMSDVLLGLAVWCAVSVVAGLLFGAWIRHLRSQGQQDDAPTARPSATPTGPTAPVRRHARLPHVPGSPPHSGAA